MVSRCVGAVEAETGPIDLHATHRPRVRSMGWADFVARQPAGSRYGEVQSLSLEQLPNAEQSDDDCRDDEDFREAGHGPIIGR